MQHSLSRQRCSRITQVSIQCRCAIPSSSQAFADWLLGIDGFLIGTRTDAIPGTGIITGSLSTNLSYTGTNLSDACTTSTSGKQTDWFGASQLGSDLAMSLDPAVSSGQAYACYT